LEQELGLFGWEKGRFELHNGVISCTALGRGLEHAAAVARRAQRHRQLGGLLARFEAASVGVGPQDSAALGCGHRHGVKEHHS
jgi:hypothetical protein